MKQFFVNWFGPYPQPTELLVKTVKEAGGKQVHLQATIVSEQEHVVFSCTIAQEQIIAKALLEIINSEFFVISNL